MLQCARTCTRMHAHTQPNAKLQPQGRISSVTLSMLSGLENGDSNTKRKASEPEPKR